MKTFLKICAMAAVFALPGMAFATVLTNVSGTADCDGFSVTADIHWGTAPTADLAYDVTLVDADGNTVFSQHYAETLTSPGDWSYQTLTFPGTWGMELCGTFTATVDATMHAVATSGNVSDSSGSFTATVDCPCQTDICNYTPGYWKNHPDMWPVSELSLGGVTYTEAQLLDILDTPVQGDATIILAYHLIAAKLNVLSGSSDSINGAITEGDNLLMQYPLFSYPTGSAKQAVLGVKDQLADYNELECPNGPVMDSMMMTIDKAAPDEVDGTWSQLKASYR